MLKIQQQSLEKIDFAYDKKIRNDANFIYKETGLSKNKNFCPKTLSLFILKMIILNKIFRDITLLEKELKDNGTKKVMKAFRNDENIPEFILKIYKEEPPNLDQAVNEIGKDLTKLWIKGSTKELLDHYFTSEKTKVYMGMTVIESSPSSTMKKAFLLQFH